MSYTIWLSTLNSVHAPCVEPKKWFSICIISKNFVGRKKKSGNWIVTISVAPSHRERNAKRKKTEIARIFPVARLSDNRSVSDGLKSFSRTSSAHNEVHEMADNSSRNAGALGMARKKNKRKKITTICRQHVLFLRFSTWKEYWFRN